MEYPEAYQNAKKRAEAKYGFYVHLVVYVVVCTLLAVINLTRSPDALWVAWPIAGWGVGLFFHAVGVFVLHGRLGVTDRMIERELGRGR